MKLRFSIALFILAFLTGCNIESQYGNGKIKGKVLMTDEKGKIVPAAKIKVCLYSETDTTLAYERKTNKRGEYKFKYLPAGSYKIVVDEDRENLEFKAIITEEEESIELKDVMIQTNK